MASKRGDDWDKKIVKRITNVFDLVTIYKVIDLYVYKNIFMRFQQVSIYTYFLDTSHSSEYDTLSIQKIIKL